MPSIITVTLNPVIDLIYIVPSFSAGETKRADSFRMVPAGKGINVSYTLSCLNCASSAYILLGERDVHVYEQVCHEKGISLHGFYSTTETRKHCTILDPNGSGITHIQTRGESVPMSRVEDLLHEFKRRMRAGDVVILAGSIPPGVDDSIFATFIKACKEKGALSFLDTSGSPLTHGTKAHPDLIKINQSEAEELTGIRVQSPSDELALLQEIHQMANIPLVVITLGKKGLIAGNAEGVWRMSIPMQPHEVKDTVGCGDALIAGLVMGYVTSMTGEALFRYALACASDAARQVGPGIVDAESLEDLNIRIESSHLGSL